MGKHGDVPWWIEAERKPAETPEDARHDYEPSEHHHPMHTDPVCAVCGRAKNAPQHG